LNNPATARFYRVDKGDRRGVVVSRIDDWSPAKGVLHRGDVLLTIAGKSIGVDGKVLIEGERVDFEALYDLRLNGDIVRFEIQRDGAPQEVVVKAGQGKPHQYSGRIFSKRPRYTVFGGIVFTALTRSVMELWGDAWEKRAPLLLRYLMREPFKVAGVSEREELVIVSDVLVNSANSFVTVGSPVVDKVNGRSIQSVKALHDYLNSMNEETLRIDFMFDEDPWILSAKHLRQVNEDTNRRYGVNPQFWLEPYSVDAAIMKDEIK
jgi:PDZ domain-containing secreted protein